MKDEEQQLEEIEASHTLGGAGEVARGDASGEGVDATRFPEHGTPRIKERGKKERQCVCVCVCV